MGENSKIAWTDHTFNPWWGCTKTSIGCKFCYAERDSKRWGYDLWGPKADRRFMSDAYWRKPMAWNKKAEKAGIQARVFCGSMCDIFEIDHPGLQHEMAYQRHRLWKLIDQTPWLEWLLLTKRIDNTHIRPPIFPSNVRLGITVVNQEEADRDIPKLQRLGVPNFLSLEPLLGKITLVDYMFKPGANGGLSSNKDIDWVIVGGESGPNARPMKREWAYYLRDQCRIADIPFFFKQMSGRAPIPDDLMIREFPE